MTKILEIVRRWWRPLGCLSIVGGIVVNYVVIPLRDWHPADGSGFALVISAFASACAVREWGKARGNG